MSTVREHVDLQSAVVSVMSRQRQAQASSAPAAAGPRDATAEAILKFRRELKSAEIEGVGVIYFYDPPSVAEREAYQKHMRLDDNGISVSMLGMVDAVIARVRNGAGRPLFTDADRRRLLEMPADVLVAIWHSIGGDRTKPLSLEDAGKK